ncbi:hypothetical protein SAMN04490244_102404 [Tranquillimonas rosea]|uniref:Transmembrane protein n=1 Tax=Tranquillimonas rosea TaxID=641238 RepID=A0A1H9RQP0_9RHOB|nr:hypothetical protein [Tranquillimonas rosea]SER74924.1 hypothetical protein SAMN04490244_102404 [Tranquillimonas rosea]
MAERHPRLIDEGSLYILVASPTIWAAHFLLCYWIAAIYCAKAASSELLSVGTKGAIWGLTAVALLGVGAVALKAWRRYNADFVINEEMTRDTDEERKSFTGHVALLLSLISTVAIVFTALPSVIVPSC